MTTTKTRKIEKNDTFTTIHLLASEDGLKRVTIEHIGQFPANNQDPRPYTMTSSDYDTVAEAVAAFDRAIEAAA